MTRSSLFLCLVKGEADTHQGGNGLNMMDSRMVYVTRRLFTVRGRV